MITLVKTLYKQFRKEIWLAVLGFIIGAIIMYLSMSFIGLNFDCILSKKEDGNYCRLMILFTGVLCAFMMSLLSNTLNKK